MPVEGTHRRTRRTSEIVVPHRPRFLTRVLGRIIYGIVKLISCTIRFRWHDEHGLERIRHDQRFIFCIWHNRLALSLILFEQYIRKISPKRRLAAMVSASRDGALLTYILELFGAQPIRGSTSRRGHQALREMVSCARRGCDLAITPDGPRGPRYRVQFGVIDLSKVTGLPIVPVSYSVNWRIKLKSWDKFIIPLPFARCDVYFGKPIHVPANSTFEERETLRRLLENSLRTLAKD